VYEGGDALSPASLSKDVKARTAIIDGASKAFAMTGYRIGFPRRAEGDGVGRAGGLAVELRDRLASSFGAARKPMR